MPSYALWTTYDEIILRREKIIGWKIIRLRKRKKNQIGGFRVSIQKNSRGVYQFIENLITFILSRMFDITTVVEC